MTVLIKWRAPTRGEDGSTEPFPPPPHAWSAKLRVVETAHDSRDDRPDLGHPYRTPVERPVPGLEIAWVADRFYLRLLLIVFLATWTALPLTAAIMHRLTADVVAFSVPVVLLVGWITLRSWRGDNAVRADVAGLHWQGTSFFGGRRDVHLTTSDLAQLFVRDTTDRSDPDSIPIPSFTVYARDHRGRDHEIADLESPEQAQWIEARLEHYLGIVDRPVPGELPRKTQP